LKVSIKHTLLSCEHGGNSIPAAWRYLFKGKQSILDSHRGWDPGALVCAKRLSAKLDIPLISSTTSRLLIDLNRSLHHRQLFSEFSRPLPETERTAIVSSQYLPYRDRLQEAINGIIKRRGFALHLSIHSFTPCLGNTVRNADIGILYDPERERELGFAACLHECLRGLDHALLIRRNYPYRGAADGATTCYRKQYAENKYAGLEIEINQKFPRETDNRTWCRLQNTIAQAITQSLQRFSI
jgi:predicted N-formylglutamate amidohydrolase